MEKKSDFLVLMRQKKIKFVQKILILIIAV
ncbi:uncharacterized protein METZ01_LOCUS140563 [marine metagenome]|uniref:Uncharacterized protein n=1 Tax=marine metagenome TaxID=408172 RepID=A0A381ZER3_9ZZZZ